jgi:hypothetical protein
VTGVSLARQHHVRFILLTYESLRTTAAEELNANVLPFLGLDSISIKEPELKKQETRSFERIIENFDAVRAGIMADAQLMLNELEKPVS